MAVLMREAIGGSLRRVRTEGRRTLREVSRRARVSLGYLSEVERGRKEASSELLAAICQALDVPLAQVLFDVSSTMADADKAAAKVPVRGGDGDVAMAADGTFGPRIVIPAPKSDRLVLVAAK